MENAATCSKCQNLRENDSSCEHCNDLEKSTDNDTSKFNSGIEIKKDILSEAHKKLRSVKILLYIIAGINLLVGLYYASQEATFVDGIISLIVCGIFIGCAIWVNHRPLTAILVAFIFWILLQLSVILIDPLLLSEGLFLKIVFFAIFIKGIASAREAKKYAEQHKEMKVKME